MADALTWKEAEPPELAPATRAETARGVIRMAFLAVLTLICLILFLSGKLLQRVLGKWVGYQYFVARLWSRAVIATLGIKRTVRGEPIRKGGVLAANHASWLDIVSLRSVTRINFVSKAEVRNWPGVGYVAEICETVFIERRRSEAMKQQQDLLERMKADELLCIFPEGTSTDGLRVLPFKSSLLSVLFLPGVHERALVQPVTVNYNINPRADLPVNFYGWWGSMSFEGHIWSLARRSSGGRVEIIFHEPMKAADYADRKSLTARCEADVRRGLSAQPAD